MTFETAFYHDIISLETTKELLVEDKSFLARRSPLNPDKFILSQAVTLHPIGWSVVGVDQWAGMKTISWARTKGLAKSPMVSNGLVMGVLDRASRGSMVNEQLKLSTEFMSFSCMGEENVTCQLPAGCKW